MERSRWIEFLINRYSKPLVRYATGLVKDKDTARDIVQQCLLKLLQQETPIPRDATQVWLYRECRASCIETFRRNLKTGAPPEPAVFNDPPTEVDATVVTKSSPLMKALQALSPRHQEIVWLKYRDRLSYKEIGDVLNLTPGHVGTVLFESLMQLGPVATGLEPVLVNEDGIDKARWMALIHNQLEESETQNLIAPMSAGEERRLEYDRLTTYSKELDAAFSERAQEGLSLAQLAGLHAQAPVRPMGWAIWVAGFSFITATMAGVLIYLPQPHEIGGVEENRSPAGVTEEPAKVTNVPVELEREFAPPMAVESKPQPPPIPSVRRVTFVKTLTKVPSGFKKTKVLGFLENQLHGENSCVPAAYKHKELVGTFEISKAGAVTGFTVKTKTEGGKKIGECLKKKLSVKTDAFKNTAKGPTRFTITLRL